MNRQWLLAVAAVALLALFPMEAEDVGELLPVELLYIDVKDETVLVRTDTGLQGRGAEAATAFRDLENAAPGKVFLETADYLVVTRRGQALLPELARVLRPATQVCLGEYADVDAPAFLGAHPPDRTLREAAEGKALPVLTWSEEGYHLEGRDHG